MDRVWEALRCCTGRGRLLPRRDAGADFKCCPGGLRIRLRWSVLSSKFWLQPAVGGREAWKLLRRLRCCLLFLFFWATYRCSTAVPRAFVEWGGFSWLRTDVAQQRLGHLSNRVDFRGRGM